MIQELLKETDETKICHDLNSIRLTSNEYQKEIDLLDDLISQMKSEYDDKCKNSYLKFFNKITITCLLVEIKTLFNSVRHNST